MKVLQAIWKWILALLGRAPALSIPHPEEPQNLTATAENTILSVIFDRWISDWKVLNQYREFWKNWPVVLFPNLIYQGKPQPAFSYPDCTYCDPTWANPGVLAHERCHVIWKDLSPEEQAAFSAAYQRLLRTNALLKFVYDRVGYMQDRLGKDSDREGHAEVGRYLGEQMPEELKQWYPRMYT